MKITLVLLALSLAFTPGAFAQRGGSSHVGGGGDETEVRFLDVANDLRGWILNGGASALTLPAGVTLAQYQSKMLALLVPQAVVVGFTNDDVVVSGMAKTCRGYIDASNLNPTILCNILRFQTTSESDQYQLVHHEYAGLAGLEQNVGAASDYSISSQLSGFLAQSTVLRLQVRPSSPNAGWFNPSACATGDLMDTPAVIRFLGAGNGLRALPTINAARRTRNCNVLTGCGEWTQQADAGPLHASMVVVNAVGGQPAHPEMRFSWDSSVNQTFQLQWSATPFADGTVNGTGSFSFFGMNTSAELYVRSNCVKLELTSVDGTQQIVGYWQF